MSGGLWRLTQSTARRFGQQKTCTSTRPVNLFLLLLLLLLASSRELGRLLLPPQLSSLCLKTNKTCSPPTKQPPSSFDMTPTEPPQTDRQTGKIKAGRLALCPPTKQPPDPPLICPHRPTTQTDKPAREKLAGWQQPCVRGAAAPAAHEALPHTAAEPLLLAGGALCPLRHSCNTHTYTGGRHITLKEGQGDCGQASQRQPSAAQQRHKHGVYGGAATTAAGRAGGVSALGSNLQGTWADFFEQ